MMGALQVDCFNCPVWYMVSWPLPHMPKFHRILCSLSPCCLHTHCRDRGVELVWGQALVRMGSGGTKGALSHISFALFGCSKQKFRHCPAYNHLNSSLLKCFTFIWFYQTGWHAWNWYLFAPFCKQFWRNFDLCPILDDSNSIRDVCAWLQLHIRCLNT